MSLTKAQQAALDVLKGVPEGKLVEGWKRSSTANAGAIPRVNIRAVSTLVKLGLAERHMRDNRFWCPYTHDERYTITEQGRTHA